MKKRKREKGNLALQQEKRTVRTERAGFPLSSGRIKKGEEKAPGTCRRRKKAQKRPGGKEKKGGRGTGALHISKGGKKKNALTTSYDKEEGLGKKKKRRRSSRWPRERDRKERWWVLDASEL